jgi:hypothetical protein
MGRDRSAARQDDPMTTKDLELRLYDYERLEKMFSGVHQQVARLGIEVCRAAQFDQLVMPLPNWGWPNTDRPEL